MIRTRSLFAVCLLLGAALSPCAAQEKEAEGKINVSGLLDWYYAMNFNRPGAGAFNGARAFDVKPDSFSLSLVEVNISRAPTAATPLGFTATLTAGRTADIVHLTEPGGVEIYKHIQQLFATYVGRGERPLTIDIGKFVTHMGYEVIESSSNDHYSRGLLFLLAIPFYHTGVRATLPVSDQLTAGLHLVNGWNNVEDDNRDKSLGGTLNWKPCGAVNLIVNAMYGTEGGLPVGGGVFGGIGFTRQVSLRTSMVDFIAIWNVNPRLKLGGNFDYADASNKGQAGGHWSGWALYARQQLGSSSAIGARLERFHDSDGLRTGANQSLSSITGTYEYTLGENVIHRLEIRRDSAGTSFFPTANATSKNQTTLTFAQVVKF